MKLGRTSAKLTAVIGLCSVAVGCSLTVTRPTQEMMNAEVAIKAAKDLNADSLVPELFRSSTDSFYKAKRDFRLKDFENARRHALKAMRLAEQAEFEAYRLGGATPEAAEKLTSPEGAYPDTEASFKESNEPSLPPETQTSSPSSASPPEEPKGMDYNEYVREQETEEAAQKEREKAKDDKKPSGQTGPDAPRGAVEERPRELPFSISSGINPIQTGALPPQTRTGPQQLFGAGAPTQDLRPKAGSPKPRSYYEGARPVPSTIEELPTQPMETVGDKDMKPLGHDGPPAKDGLEEITVQEPYSIGNEKEDEK